VAITAFAGVDDDAGKNKQLQQSKNPAEVGRVFFSVSFESASSFISLAPRQCYSAEQQHGGGAGGFGYDGGEAGVAAGAEHSAVGVELHVSAGEIVGERAFVAELGGELVPLVIGEDVAGDGEIAGLEDLLALRGVSEPAGTSSCLPPGRRWI